MNCPNCGLANSNSAKFCANCGTAFTSGSTPTANSYEPQSPQGWRTTVTGRNSLMKNLGLGCLIVLLIFFFFGLSCTRACFRHRRYYRRYGAIICPVAPRQGFGKMAGRPDRYQDESQEISSSGGRNRC
ncbi:MAG: zinc-ribbon domain-containing protein [Bryobacteraceae bacterium]